MKARRNFLLLLVAFFTLNAVDAQVTVNLSYDQTSAVYTVSMNSDNAYGGPMARLSSSSQITLVFPAATGGFLATNITNLQTAGAIPLEWELSTQENAPAENPSADYLIFSTANAGTYTPFDIAAGTSIDLFSFESGNPCVGPFGLYVNGSDPLEGNVSLNAGNNIVILGGGPGNLYTGNTSGVTTCSGNTACTANAGTLGY